MRITLHPSKPLIWWYNRRDMIDMNPSYQRRGRLWSPSDKAYLIDSIINGFDVPKLYLADFQLGDSPLNANRLPYAIIDGKQRLEAIFDFFDGKLVLNDDFILRSDRKLKLGGLSLKDLRSNYTNVAETFETETVDMMSVVTDNEDDINELFVRLNRSKPLTGAEIRNAVVGPVADVIRTVAKHPFFSENIKFSVSRAGDYNAAAKLVIFEYNGKPTGTKKRDLDNFAKGENIDHTKLELSALRTIDTLDIMQEIFLPRDELLGSAGPVPVYYWLARQASASQRSILREFILRFEADRKSYRSAHAQGVSVDGLGEFVRYETLKRAPMTRAAIKAALKSSKPRWTRSLPSRTCLANLFRNYGWGACRAPHLTPLPAMPHYLPLDTLRHIHMARLILEGMPEEVENLTPPHEA